MWEPYGFGQTFGSILPSDCDNLVVVHVVNTHPSRSQRGMRSVRAFTLHCMNYNIVFQACHVSGVNNELADALSHQQIDWFRALAPGAQVRPERLSQEVWSTRGLKLTGQSA